MSKSSVKLTREQINFIIDKTGIPDRDRAIEYFAEIMIMERVHPYKMAEVVDKMMARDRKRIK